MDLEEWFHICGVGPLMPDHWDRLPSRVESTTRTLLEMLDRAGVTATWFVVGWVAERHPRLIEEVRTAGHDTTAIVEINPGAEDEAVLALARSEARVLLTEDKDFGLLAYAGGLETGGTGV